MPSMTWAIDLSLADKEKDTFPCLLAMCGSTLVLMVVSIFKGGGIQHQSLCHRFSCRACQMLVYL